MHERYVHSPYRLQRVHLSLIHISSGVGVAFGVGVASGVGVTAATGTFPDVPVASGASADTFSFKMCIRDSVLPDVYISQDVPVHPAVSACQLQMCIRDRSWDYVCSN